MAERAGVRVPRVDRVIKAGGGTALLVMDRVAGSSLDQLPRSRSRTTFSRLATYWLPVVPGWAALQILQRRDYV